MSLVHKSIDVRPEVWIKLRLHAVLSHASLRDYLTYLVLTSIPVGLDASEPRRVLDAIKASNRQPGDRPTTVVPHRPIDEPED